jgi:hypothetical protein
VRSLFSCRTFVELPEESGFGQAKFTESNVYTASFRDEVSRAVAKSLELETWLPVSELYPILVGYY